MKKFGNIVWGIAFVVVGIIWGLNAMGITDVNIFFRGWWTFIIIIPCIIGLFREKEKFGNVIGIIVGVTLLLASNRVIDWSIIGRLIVPFVLVCIGAAILLKSMINKNVYEKIKKLEKNMESEEQYATFSSQEINVTEDFKGASLNAIFGGIDYSLKESKIEGEQLLNASAIFGGIDIIVPAGVNVQVKSTSIFGGVGNSTSKVTGENVPTIYVDAFCLFGGVDIK